MFNLLYYILSKSNLKLVTAPRSKSNNVVSEITITRPKIALVDQIMIRFIVKVWNGFQIGMTHCSPFAPLLSIAVVQKISDWLWCCPSEVVHWRLYNEIQNQDAQISTSEWIPSLAYGTAL